MSVKPMGCRPLTEKHEQKIAGSRRKCAIDKARAETRKLREAHSEGLAHFRAAAEGEEGSRLLYDPLEPVPPARHWYTMW